MTYKEWRDKKYPGIEKNNIVAEAVAITAWLASRRETLAHIREQVEGRLDLNKISLRNLITRGRYEEDKAILSIIERA
jgi:hypothetical protein